MPMAHRSGMTQLSTVNHPSLSMPRTDCPSLPLLTTAFEHPRTQESGARWYLAETVHSRPRHRSSPALLHRRTQPPYQTPLYLVYKSLSIREMSLGLWTGPPLQTQTKLVIPDKRMCQLKWSARRPAGPETQTSRGGQYGT
jgi:hypothetical protein